MRPKSFYNYYIAFLSAKHFISTESVFNRVDFLFCNFETGMRCEALSVFNYSAKGNNTVEYHLIIAGSGSNKINLKNKKSRYTL
jgi:hypothetical protein